MRIIDRYILTSILTIFFVSMFIFSFLYIIIDMASNLDDFITRKVPLAILFQYYASFFPIIISQTSFIASLIAILLTFSHLNTHNEVIALRTSGLSFWQLTKPAIVFGCLVAALIFWVNEKLVPQADQISRDLRKKHIVVDWSIDKKKRKVIHNLTFYGLKNRLFFIDSFDPNTNELGGITLIDYDEGQNVLQKLVALKGEWTGLAWKLSYCHITTLDPEQITRPIKVKIYDEKLIDIKETPEDFLKQRLLVTSMNIRQLHEYISRFSTSGAIKALNNLRVDLHYKIAYPFGNIVITLIGLPLALMMHTRRAMAFSTFGIVLGIGFFYHVLTSVALALGKGGFLPPITAAWLAPMLFTSVAFYLIKTKVY